MKIISKFKDFYDYKVSKYGVDEKLVFNRKTYCEYFQALIGNIDNINIDTDYRISEDDFNKKLKEDIKVIDEKNIHKVLFIGEKVIHLFFTENGIYTHFDIKNIEILGKFSNLGYKKRLIFKDGKTFNIFSRFGDDWDYLLSYNSKRFMKLNINKEDIILNEPMIFIELIGRLHNNRYVYIYKFTYNPYLSKLGVYLDEDFIWQSLVEFLSNKRSEKEIIPEISDKDKILSKGFDLKASFRPKMKRKK